MPPSKRRLTDEQIDQMAAWREAGKSYAWIGMRLGLSGKAVRWQCLRVGADHPKGHEIAPSKMPMLTRRNGNDVRRFTAEEDARLIALELSGMNFSQIARELGRARNSVVGRAMTLARHADRAERASV